MTDKLTEQTQSRLTSLSTLIITGLIAVLSAFTANARAEKSQFATATCSKVMQDIYNIDSDAFAADIRGVGTSSRDERARTAFLREYMALMQYTAANNQKNYDAFFAASDAAFGAISGSKYEDNLSCWLHIHKCMVYIYDGSMLSGGIQFWKSYRAFKSAEDKYAAYDGQLPLRGIYNVILSQIPEKWKSLAGFFGFGEGDIATGFNQIEQYRRKVQNIAGLNDEAVMFSFANMFFSFEQNMPADIMKAIRENDAPAVRYAYILSCGRSQNGEAAYESLQSTPGDVLNRFPLLYHQKGKYALRRLEPDEAIKWGKRFAETYSGVSNKNGVYVDMAYAYMLKGDRKSAKAMVDKCLSIKSDFDIDRRAMEEAPLVMDTPMEILRARLNFEYGKFAEAEKELKSYRPRQKDLAEYYFRLGRTTDKQGEYGEAMKWYDKAMSQSANSTRYFGPYAAVHAAEICVKKKDKAGADRYLGKARKLNNGEYKKELDQRIELTERVVKKM